MEKKRRSDFEIEIFNLENKQYTYDFVVDKDFFKSQEGSVIEEGGATVHVVLDKSDAFFDLLFMIEGEVGLVCDRSLEKFNAPISINEKLICKYGQEELEIDEQVIQITKSTQMIDLSQYIYEFISLSIPMKKLHPKFEDEEDNDDGLLIYSSKDDEAADKKIDPRWGKLKDLK